MKNFKLIALLSIMALCIPAIKGQTVAIKTNLLEWATTSPNIGAEFGLSRKSTLQLTGGLNPWSFEDTRIRFWNLQPEYRYWFCEKFSGHFIGIHALGGQYNFRNFNMPLTSLPSITGENKGRHIEGWYVGGGVTYGYQWILSKHWNLEAAVGVGYCYSPYKYYGRCDRLFDKDGNTLPDGTGKSGDSHYVGPTQLSLSLEYLF